MKQTLSSKFQVPSSKLKTATQTGRSLGTWNLEPGTWNCRRGQAIYVVVLFMFVLAGLLFLILNTGEKLNHKVEMQGAADSVAATGAAWYARGLNVVSMANVTETQLLALIVLLDTLETVTPPATECIDDLVKHGRDLPVDLRVCDVSASNKDNGPGNMFLVVGNASSEQQIIRQFGDIVSGVDWPPYLQFDNGVLWECAKLMDGFSKAMAKDTPRAALRESVDIADKNHADCGFMTPFWPELPVESGEFQDFRDPMAFACLPRRYGGTVIGGFSQVMGYRGYRNQVLGPWGFWREPLTATRPMGLFDLSRFSVLFNVVSLVKLDMMFGGTYDRVSLRKWEMDYDKVHGSTPPETMRTWWETVGFDARYEPAEETKPFPPDADAPWATTLKHESSPDPRTAYRGELIPISPDFLRELSRRGMSLRRESSNLWPDLAGWTRARKAEEGADPRQAVWYRVDRRRTAQYPELRIFAPHPPTYPDGSPWPYTDAEMKTYWHISMRRFNGAEKDADETLHRKYVGDGNGPSPALAPTFFTQAGDNYLDNIERRYTFNGYAYRTGKVANWAQRFINPNPIEDLVCYAQARVYNRWSWDLFTQHWKVKIMRVQSVDPDPQQSQRWQLMLSEVNKGVPGQAQQVASQLTAERLKPVRDMLNAYSQDFVKEITL